MFLLPRRLNAFCCRYVFFFWLSAISASSQLFFFYLAIVLFNQFETRILRRDIVSSISTGTARTFLFLLHLLTFLSFLCLAFLFSLFPPPAMSYLGLCFYSPIFLSVFPCLCAYWKGDTRLRPSSWHLRVLGVANNTASRRTSCC